MPFQVINNACATQAIVSVLLNCTHPDMLLGETLTEFKEFSLSFDAAVSWRMFYFTGYLSLVLFISIFKTFLFIFSLFKMKGLALSNSEVIRQVHNSFARLFLFAFMNFIFFLFLC